MTCSVGREPRSGNGVSFNNDLFTTREGSPQKITNCMQSKKSTKNVQRVLGCEGMGGTGKNGKKRRNTVTKPPKDTRECATSYRKKKTGAKLIPQRFSVYSGGEECLSRLKVGSLIGEAGTGESNHSSTQRGEGCLQRSRGKLPKHTHTQTETGLSK